MAAISFIRGERKEWKEAGVPAAFRPGGRAPCLQGCRAQPWGTESQDIIRTSHRAAPDGVPQPHLGCSSAFPQCLLKASLLFCRRCKVYATKNFNLYSAEPTVPMNPGPSCVTGTCGSNRGKGVQWARSGSTLPHSALLPWDPPMVRGSHLAGFGHCRTLSCFCLLFVCPVPQGSCTFHLNLESEHSV